MRARLAAVVVVLAAAAGAPAAVHEGGQIREVTMPGKVFVPGEVDALVGDTVVWRNADATSHTVTANDDSFDSGYLSPGGTFSQTFAKPGLYAYHCTIHKFMRGAVRVVPVALSGPRDPVLAGGRVALQGLAPAGTTEVTLEAIGGGARRLTPIANGSFSAVFRVFAPLTFRAVVGGRASPLVRVAVAPRLTVGYAGGSISGSVAPSRPNARLVLQRYDREHFSWTTVARGRVSGGTRVAMTLPASTPGRFRIVVRGGDGWADGVSGSVVRR
jgi:plastocyanin